MLRYQKTIAMIVVVIGILWVVVSAVEVPQKRHTYEIRTPISAPEYRTDASRAIDAYERLMERYMDLTGTNLVTTATEVKDISRRIHALEVSMVRIEAKLDLISQALGVNTSAPMPQSPPIKYPAVSQPPAIPK